MPKSITLELGDDAVQRLASMRAKARADSDAEVIKNALCIYEWHIAQADAGLDIGLYEKDGTPIKRVQFFMDSQTEAT